MTLSQHPVDPFAVVAAALGCSANSLSAESAMYRDHGWDSFGHVSVIIGLEEAYGISIPNEELVSLTTMKAILELAERLRATDHRNA